jgi:hypothetical protein
MDYDEGYWPLTSVGMASYLKLHRDLCARQVDVDPSIHFVLLCLAMMEVE